MVVAGVDEAMPTALQQCCSASATIKYVDTDRTHSITA
jgi:hypothetical protein